MNASEMNDFRGYVEEQRHLCYGVEGGTPGVHGRLARQYDFLIETIDTYQEIDQPQLNENQQIVLEWLKLQAPTAKPMQVIFWMMNNAAWGKLDELRKPIMHLTDKQQAQVLEEFGKWVQEQEEE